MNNQENGAFGTADPNAKTDSASGLLAKIIAEIELNFHFIFYFPTSLLYL